LIESLALLDICAVYQSFFLRVHAEHHRCGAETGRFLAHAWITTDCFAKRRKAPFALRPTASNSPLVTADVLVVTDLCLNQCCDKWT